jgi:uncharacterized membrane protein YgcG
MNIRSLTLVGLLVAFSAVCSSLMVSAQGNLTISGTVFARSGSSVQGAAVIACLLKNDACDDSGSGLVQIKGSGASAKYQLTGLAADEFVMLAWRDLNSNQDLDNGDEVGVYQKSGKATQVKAPAQNIDIRLVQFNGDLEAILQQADEAPAQAAEQPSTPATTPSTTPATSSGGLALSGTVKALAGSSLDDAIVLAGVWENGKYNQDKSKGVKVGANGKFSVTGLEKIPYVLFAWRDLDGDSDISKGDEVAPFKPGNKFALATPPLSNISLQFEQGDSSLDALVNLTRVNAGPAPNGPKATTPKAGSSNSSSSGSGSSGSSSSGSSSSGTPTSSPGGSVSIDCGKKEAFYGDYGCIIPPVDSYLGNTKCPVEPKFPGVKQEKGFFSGYVYDSCNRPMANLQVSLSQYKGGLQTTVRTDSKGFYRVESRYVIGAYVYASVKANVGGNEFDFTVFPPNRIYGNDGGIQNMHYDTRDSDLWFYPNFYGFDVPEKPLVEFILEPVKLLDGTTGKPQVFQFQTTGGNMKFSGIKYGQYNVSAFLITPKGRIRTWLENKDSGKLERLPVSIVGTDVVQVSVYLSQTGNP